jgi:hypothetical protein
MYNVFAVTHLPGTKPLGPWVGLHKKPFPTLVKAYQFACEHLAGGLEVTSRSRSKNLMVENEHQHVLVMIAELGSEKKWHMHFTFGPGDADMQVTANDQHVFDEMFEAWMK